MLGPITYLDAGLIAICFISGLVAMYRGLAREVLSILSWAAAGAAVFYFIFFQKGVAEDLAQRIGTQVLVVELGVGAVIFLITLIVVHLITARISDAILDSRVGMIDRVLGFMFGVARGFLIVVVAYMFAAFFHCKGSQTGDFAAKCGPGDLPFWAERAQSLPTIISASNSIYAVMDAHVPSSLTPPREETPAAPGTPGTQGALEKPRGDELALEAPAKFHICVAWQARVT